MSEKHKNETQLQVEQFVDATHHAADFIVTRYPYLCAVLLMVSMPDEIKDKKEPILNFNLVYAQLGFYFTVGTLMSFNMLGLKRVSGALMAVSCGVTAYTEFDNSYRQVVLARLLFRNFACIGCYIMVAGGLGKGNSTNQSHRLLNLGRQIIGAYIVLLALLLIYNKKEFIIHARFIPGGGFVVWALIICYVVCGISIDYGISVVSLCRVVMIVLFCVTLLVDMEADTWQQHGKIKKWKVYTIAAYHVPLIGVLMLIRSGYC